jgi:MFS family permease
MCLALALLVGGVTMLVNALPLIAEKLNLSASRSRLGWYAYALPFAALSMIAGGLGDRYGRRGALLAGTALFGMGSVPSATADGGNALLAAGHRRRRAGVSEPMCQCWVLMTS